MRNAGFLVINMCTHMSWIYLEGLSELQTSISCPYDIIEIQLYAIDADRYLLMLRSIQISAQVRQFSND